MAIYSFCKEFQKIWKNEGKRAFLLNIKILHKKFQFDFGINFIKFPCLIVQLLKIKIHKKLK